MAKEQIRKEEIVEFTGWANGGAALGRLADGRVVFTPGVLPGERALVSYADREARFISAQLIRLTERSPMRIEPRCPLFGHCAGCHLQHLEYPDQLHAKKEILTDHLKRLAGMEDPEKLILPFVRSPREWDYARTLRLVLDENGDFCMTDTNGALTRLEAYCPITAECLNEVLASFTFEGESGIDEAEFRADEADGIQLILHGQSDTPEDEMENDTEISVVYRGPESSYVMAGVSTLRQHAAGMDVCASDSSSFINNPEILDALCEKLLPLLEGIRDAALLDVNCGTGFWSRLFADKCREINAVMPDENECEDFVYNLDEAENVSLYIGTLQEILPGLTVPENEWILIEGGLSGLSEADLNALCDREPSKILCLYEDPAILARDLKRLQSQGRKPEWILPYDTAPQTASFGIVVCC